MNHVIIRKYGPYVEITRHQRLPFQKKVRVSRPRNPDRPIAPRRPDNIARTKRLCVRRVSAAIEAFGRPLFVTLTFAGDASDTAYASHSLRRFQVRLRNEYPDVESIFVPELSPRDRIHFHGFLFNVPMHLGDIKKGRRTVQRGTERSTRTLARLWNCGYVDAKQTDGSGKLAFYIAKYITKAADQIIFNGIRMLRCSRGIPKEIEIRDELAKQLEAEYSKDIPLHEWEDHSPYVGDISKRLYLKHESDSVLPKID